MKKGKKGILRYGMGFGDFSSSALKLKSRFDYQTEVDYPASSTARTRLLPLAS